MCILGSSGKELSKGCSTDCVKSMVHFFGFFLGLCMM